MKTKFIVLTTYLLLSIFHISGQVNQYISGQEGPAGGLGVLNGTVRSVLANDPNYTLSNILIYSGDLIDAIDFKVINKKEGKENELHCGGYGGSTKNFVLSPGEFIVRISGKYEKYLEWLYIQTSGGNGPQFVEFGNKQSHAEGYFDYQAIDGYKIGNFIVKADNKYVEALGVVLQKK
jgi:Jacalin-like lectin domain